MRNLTEANLSDAVVAAMAGAQVARFKTIMTSLIRHLHTFIQEINLTEAEWFAGIQFLTAVGRSVMINARNSSCFPTHLAQQP